uniref:Uncharacterized protein n=1 Tax=Tanacetum cinerariifolium TaxID=118510 RepID=A0A6L2M3J1_TANCI|nr:hypothetical protein [Tanacetum cinerariifolium]
MKNLDDVYTIRDQFLNDKSTKHDLGKPNVEAKVVSMVTVPIYQASSLTPPLSTPVFNVGIKSLLDVVGITVAHVLLDTKTANTRPSRLDVRYIREPIIPCHSLSSKIVRFPAWHFSWVMVVVEMEMDLYPWDFEAVAGYKGREGVCLIRAGREKDIQCVQCFKS